MYKVLCGCFCAVFGCCVGLIAPHFFLLAAKTTDKYSNWSMINILWGKSGAAETRKNAYLCCLLGVCVFPLKTIVSLKVWHEIDRMKKIKYALIKMWRHFFYEKKLRGMTIMIIPFFHLADVPERLRGNKWAHICPRGLCMFSLSHIFTHICSLNHHFVHHLL